MFTERQKARRRLKQIEKKLAAGGAVDDGEVDSQQGTDELQAERMKFLEDIAYTRWFPRG